MGNMSEAINWLSMPGGFKGDHHHDHDGCEMEKESFMYTELDKIILWQCKAAAKAAHFFPN